MRNQNLNRRKFIRFSATGAAIAATGQSLFGAEHIFLPQPDNALEQNVTSNTDVLVVGGGTAGTIAAIQAARAGAKTMIIERGSQLGGTTTTGGVAFPGLFHAWGKQII